MENIEFPHKLIPLLQLQLHCITVTPAIILYHSYICIYVNTVIFIIIRAVD